MEKKLGEPTAQNWLCLERRKINKNMGRTHKVSNENGSRDWQQRVGIYGGRGHCVSVATLQGMLLVNECKLLQSQPSKLESIFWRWFESNTKSWGLIDCKIIMYLHNCTQKLYWNFIDLTLKFKMEVLLTNELQQEIHQLESAVYIHLKSTLLSKNNHQVTYFFLLNQ